MNKKTLWLYPLVMLFFIGCSQNNLNIKSKNEELKAYATVDDYYSNSLDKLILKDIFVLDFIRDNVDFSDRLFYKLDNIFIDNEKFYNASRRDDLVVTFKYNDFDHANFEKRQFKKQHKYYITGEIISSDYNKLLSHSEALDYDNCYRYNEKTGECATYKTYDAICTNYKYDLAIKVIVREFDGGKIIFDKLYKKDRILKDCTKFNAANVPLLSENLKILANDVSNLVIEDFLPRKKKINVPFITMENLDYYELDKELLGNALSVFKQSRNKSIDIFKKLVANSNNSSSAALYNLALAYESILEYTNALNYYNMAFDIASMQDKIDPKIIDAIKRIEKKIKYQEVM